MLHHNYRPSEAAKAEAAVYMGGGGGGGVYHNAAKPFKDLYHVWFYLVYYLKST